MVNKIEFMCTLAEKGKAILVNDDKTWDEKDVKSGYFENHDAKVLRCFKESLKELGGQYDWRGRFVGGSEEFHKTFKVLLEEKNKEKLDEILKNHREFKVLIGDILKVEKEVEKEVKQKEYIEVMKSKYKKTKMEDEQIKEKLEGDFNEMKEEIREMREKKTSDKDTFDDLFITFLKFDPENYTNKTSKELVELRSDFDKFTTDWKNFKAIDQLKKEVADLYTEAIDQKGWKKLRDEVKEIKITDKDVETKIKDFKENLSTFKQGEKDRKIRQEKRRKDLSEFTKKINESEKEEIRFNETIEQNAKEIETIKKDIVKLKIEIDDVVKNTAKVKTGSFLIDFKQRADEIKEALDYLNLNKGEKRFKEDFEDYRKQWTDLLEVFEITNQSVFLDAADISDKINKFINKREFWISTLYFKPSQARSLKNSVFIQSCINY